MHEMAIAVNILDIVKKEMALNEAHRLKCVRLRVGAMSSVEPESLAFCFGAITDGTALEGAMLDIEEVPLKGRCSACSLEFDLDLYFSTPCPKCGGIRSELVSGRELDIVSMEVD